MSDSCAALFAQQNKKKKKTQSLIHLGVVLLTGSKSVVSSLTPPPSIDVSWLSFLRILPVKCKIGWKDPTWSACKWDYRIADGYTALLTCRRRCIDRVSVQVPFLGSCSELLSGEWEGEFKERALKSSIVSGSMFSERQLNSMMPQSCFELSSKI